MTTARRFSTALLALLLCAGVSCTPDRVSAPSESTPDYGLLGLGEGGGLLGTGLARGLLSCRPLPADSAQQVIGPRGGTIRVGPHTLTIPAGALSRNVTITAQAPSDSVNSVRLFPEGLTFARGKPATLTLSYSNCSLLGRLLPKRVAYTTDLLQILQLLPSLDDLLHQRVSAPLQHFSRYAVAW